MKLNFFALPLAILLAFTAREAVASERKITSTGFQQVSRDSPHLMARDTPIDRRSKLRWFRKLRLRRKAKACIACGKPRTALPSRQSSPERHPVQQQASDHSTATYSGAGSSLPLVSQDKSLFSKEQTSPSPAGGPAGRMEFEKYSLETRSPCKWLKDKLKGCFRPPPPRGRGRVVVNNYRTQELMVLSQQAHDRDHGTIGIGGVQRAWKCKSRGTCVHAYSQQFEPPPPQADEDE
ncbi:hypothetical protein BCV69DRAFT_275009 [Microstroma glucosiphilum]|uniref:Uncharacterized protein n=1 Tax=Pseudomicrostroma glucosiphilum TaxID=1684307 RepID=A0A316UE26_9BASI|nr:hypothetical protein BCV69DRAFT_275009 [Pseudomicrostroma glucosiphilum]PWN23466.1 hypothetical protein BCV69DRAFT_275009 [Pseudomicrostroma glucosiphilum]